MVMGFVERKKIITGRENLGVVMVREAGKLGVMKVLQCAMVTCCRRSFVFL